MVRIVFCNQSQLMTVLFLLALLFLGSCSGQFRGRPFGGRPRPRPRPRPPGFGFAGGFNRPNTVLCSNGELAACTCSLTGNTCGQGDGCFRSSDRVYSCSGDTTTTSETTTTTTATTAAPLASIPPRNTRPECPAGETVSCICILNGRTCSRGDSCRRRDGTDIYSCSGGSQVQWIPRG